MNTSEFHHLADALMQHTTRLIDDHVAKTDDDVDYEQQGNVLTITLENGSKIIINTQEPLYQIWMATRQQGYHFRYQSGQWLCDRSGETFIGLLQRALIEQA